MVQIQNTVDIGWSWRWISLGQTFVIFWHTREHPTGYLITGKKQLREKKRVVQIPIVVQNILYHYLVVLNIKIRN